MARKAILLVEDNELNMEMADFLLQNAGFEVMQAEDAETGIRIAKENLPDLILMDIHLPAMNGYEASKIIKADPLTANIPVLAFTAHAMEEELQKALEAGCDGIINKPIDVDLFPSQIAEFLITTDKDAKSSVPA